MEAVLETLVPLYLLVGLGLLASRIRAFEGGAKVLSTYVYYLAFPAFLFIAVAEAPHNVELPWSFFWISALLPFGSALVTYFAVRRKAGEVAAAQLALTGGHGNVSYFGIPLCIAVFGPSAALPAAVAQLIHNLVFWIGYPVLRSRSQQGARTRALLQAGPLNPAVVALALGLVASGTLQAPQMVTTATTMLADSAIPAALVSVGLAVGNKGSSISWNASWLAAVVLLKNIWLPLLTFVIVKLCFHDGVGGIVAGTLVLMAAMPTSVASYSLAVEHDPQATSVAQSIMVSTACGLITIPAATLSLGLF